MRTRYVSKDTLTSAADRSPHRLQKAAWERMSAIGWRCYATRTIDGVLILSLQHADNGAFGVLYPDGTFSRPVKGKRSVTIIYQRARDAAHHEGNR